MMSTFESKKIQAPNPDIMEFLRWGSLSEFNLPGRAQFKVAQSYAKLLEYISSKKTTIYGLHTGFGTDVNQNVGPDWPQHQFNLFKYLKVGVSEPLDEKVVRRALKFQAYKSSLGYTRFKELRYSGARAADRLICPPKGKEFLVDLISVMIGHYVLVPEMNLSTTRGISSNPKRQDFFRKNVFLEIHSSGSTGALKFRYYTQESILKQLASLADYFKAETELSRLAVLPLGHAFGLVLDLLLGLYSKGIMFCPITDSLRSSKKFPKAPESILIGGVPLSPSLRKRAVAWPSTIDLALISEGGKISPSFLLSREKPKRTL